MSPWRGYPRRASSAPSRPDSVRQGNRSRTELRRSCPIRRPIRCVGATDHAPSARLAGRPCQGQPIVAVRSVVPKPSSMFWRTSRQSPGATGSVWSVLVDGPWFGKRRVPGPGRLVEQVDLVRERVTAPVGDEMGRARVARGEPCLDPVRVGESRPVEPRVLDLDRGCQRLEGHRQVDDRRGGRRSPGAVTCQFACAWLVLPVKVPDVMSLQPITFAPTFRHMWVLPAGVVRGELGAHGPGAVAAERDDPRLAPGAPDARRRARAGRSDRA